jgi:DNA-binding NarL/FixJ family response regulator
MVNRREAMIRTLLADDHALVREGLKRILSEEFGTVIYGEAQNGQEVLDCIRTQDWDIVILDITMPGRSGLDILAELKRERPGLHVLVLSMHPEDQFCLRVLKAGARGYITKEMASKEVVTAVRTVLSGNTYVSPSFAEKVVFDLVSSGGRPRHENLSHREFQVLSMIATGKSLTQIAGSIGVSVKTVSTYRTRLLAKLKVSTNAELTAYAIKHQIVG